MNTGTLKSFLAFCTIVTVVVSCRVDRPVRELSLWYDQPAGAWEEALPLGNGRLGMMPDGGVTRENITLNDITMWSGSEENTRNSEALRSLPRIRELLLKGENLQAQELQERSFVCGGKGSGEGNGADQPFGSYQLLGNLHLDYFFRDPDTGSYSGYKRGLTLNNGVAWTRFKMGGVAYQREYFVSAADDVMVIRLTADHKNKLNFILAWDRPECFSFYSNDDILHMEGRLNNGVDGKGTRYMAQIRVIPEDGTLLADSARIQVNGASSVCILVSAGTDLRDTDFVATLEKRLREAGEKSYEELKDRHAAVFRDKFDRVELNLGPDNDQLPTDQRLQVFQQTGDPAFAALYFQYGRYLMISGTRENSLPMNLQGLWANTVRTPWNGDYHLNINLQMNYWPMEVANLPELHRPLTQLVKDMVPSGEVSARSFYGVDGWVAHMMTNPWYFTAPGEHASWGATNTGGAWLCRHLWEHYAYTSDTAYLDEVYPAMKGAARFFLSSMIREPEHGWLVTAPSSSPENSFYVPGTRTPISVCMGPTMDIQIVRDLFSDTKQASVILGKDPEFAAELEKALAELPPMQISPNGGYLQEWLKDYEEVEMHHRHVSHLYGLYPSNQISVEKTPELAEAARRTLGRRGNTGTGWSRAWKINFWARLHDGDRASQLLKNLLIPVGGQTGNKGGGTYPNLFCAHPPFQIDGNLGGCAGIAEMLVQSQNGYAEFLPALPSEWKDGHFKGLRLRGAITADASWKDGRLTEVTLKADKDCVAQVKLPEYAGTAVSQDAELEISDGIIRVPLNRGKSVRLTF